MFAGQRVAIVGTGLIGGSIGLGLRARVPGVTIVGHDRDRAVLARARRVGALDEGVDDLAGAVAGAGVVVLAAPVDQIPGLCHELAPHVGGDAVVTDVASAKSGAVAAGGAAFGERFIGGHPMAGSERHGIDAAEGALFEGAAWILTPSEITSSATYRAVAGLATTLGARPVAVDPAAHDELVARLSHVPQLTASALVDVAVRAGDRDALLGLAGAGFRDVTRIAASEPDLWVGILRANSAAVSAALASVGASLERAADLIGEGRWDELAGWLRAARDARVELFAKPAYPDVPMAVTMLVPDRPGVLAEVTTAAGQLGANIEDLRIIHSTEGGSGRLELVIAGTTEAEALARALTGLGYRVEVAPVAVAGD